MSHLVHDFEIFDAARNNDVKRVRELLDAGVDINVQDFDRRQTPLHLACANGAKAVVELLVKRGADMSVRDCNELSPLHLLVQNKLDVLAVWLVHMGADLYQKDRKLFSPLDYGLPSTQRELRLAAGEITAGSATPGEKTGPAVKAPQLYKHPSRRHEDRLASSAPQSVEVRVHLDNGSYKTVRVGPDVTCSQLVPMAAEKFNIPAQFAQHAILYENKQGAERLVRGGEHILDIRRKWPHIISSNGKETLDQCFFVLRASAGAPDATKEYFDRFK